MDLKISDKFEEAKQRMNEIFDDILSERKTNFQTRLPAWKQNKSIKEDFVSPLADFWETDKEFKAEIDLPGINKEDLEINVYGNNLEIKAEKSHEEKKEENGSFRQERYYSGFYRQIPLPEKSDPDSVKAEYENGVLKISVPKTEELNSDKKRIELK